MSRKGNRLRNVKNFGFTVGQVPGSPAPIPATNFNRSNGVVRNMANYITPVQLVRLRTDVSMWRDAMNEAERAYYPYRVKMQRIYIDTILNGHVNSLVERREDLTLLRRYEIVDSKGVASDVLTQALENSPWFNDYVAYSLDAMFFGYSLISIGDIVGGEIQDVSIVPRWFVSPDRECVGSYIYANGGIKWEDEPYNEFHVYVKTKSDNGVSPCGYGLFYNIALYEIFLRNTLGYNGDFVELYAMPYRIGRTTKTDESERAELMRAIQQMGSAGYALLDGMDEIEFLETKLSGSGYQAYDNLELRCQKTVSKLILGHADAADSVPGKLGNDGEESPASKAMRDKQVKDGRNMEANINRLLAPKLRNLGLGYIPEGYTLRYKNDEEKEAFRKREDASNLQTATIAKTMKDAGLKMDAKYFEERTGIPTEEAPEPEPIKPGDPGQDDEDNPDDKASVTKIKNRLDNLYK